MRNEAPMVTLSSEAKVGRSVPEYKTIRRRYRFLEFFSLGFLLIMAVIVVVFLLRVRKKSEEARKLRAETYLVEELDSRPSIVSHFDGLIERGTEFTVLFEGISRQFTAKTSALHAGGKAFLTEALIPSPGKGLPLEGATVRIEYIYNEIPYSFLTQLLVEAESPEDKSTFRLPELIKYTQRRHAYRVKPPVLEPVTAVFPLPGKTLHESVLDLSTGGFSIKSGNPIQPGKTYREVKLTLPGKKPLKIDVKCLYRLPSALSGGEKVVRFGFSIENPGIKEEKSLMAFVSDVRWKKP